ncbi:MAG: DUF58 domain-containing protein [Verrucomicrobia bacterium]|nr:DUF58 domain-containing protein [Verrucomicrobiota bacterium]
MNEAYRTYLMDGERAGMRYALSVPPNAPFGASGGHLSNRPGSSLEFMDHREYQPGDDLRRIDWSAYARSDRLTVKLYREEVSPHLDILIDGSRSMALDETDKARATLGLAAMFAAAASNAGYSHCGWLARGGCEKIGNGTDRPSVWEGIEFDHRDNVTESFRRLSPAWRPRAIRVFLSDLFWLDDPLHTLQRLAEGASAVVVVQVVAKADAEPPERGNIRLVDSESDEMMEVFLDAVAQKRYREAFARHQENWHRGCRQVGALMTTLVAEDVLGGWQLDALVAAEVLKVA